MAQYRALVGLEYPPDRRVEAGQIVDDLPGKSVKWLLEQGLIEPANGKPADSKKDAKPDFAAPAPAPATPVEDEEDEG